MRDPVLDIANLSLTIRNRPVLDAISLSVAAGEIHALVGESGSGKSMTALSVMQLLPRGSALTGSIKLAGQELTGLDDHALTRLRGDDMAMVFQEPMTALNPVQTIGRQVAEAVRLHRRTSWAEAHEQAGQALQSVGLDPDRTPPTRFAHELSGGQRQRVGIAMACILKPRLLIADEPTTALDVLMQDQILELMERLVRDTQMGLLLISHDLGVVAGRADRITILRDGRVKDQGLAVPLLRKRSHAYTRQLAQASRHVPIWTNRVAPASDQSPPLLRVANARRDYIRKAHAFAKPVVTRAVDDVSFTIQPGRMTGLVGPSGCGKSTLARLILGLDTLTAGTIEIGGKRVDPEDHTAMRPLRRQMQPVFQDPYGSFDPRMTVERLITEPLHLEERRPSRAERRERALVALAEVGLMPDSLDRYPHEFSGGQRQRLAIARALIIRPRLIIADEPVSALDVSIRAQILDLFAQINDTLNVAFLFITHDLAVARAITHDVMVMDSGRIVESGPVGTVLSEPQSATAKALVAAAPDLERALAKRSA